MTLREILAIICGRDGLPDEWNDTHAYSGVDSDLVTIAFSAEDDSMVTLPADHPLLVPWYGCEAYSIYAHLEKNVTQPSIMIWLKLDEYAANAGWIRGR